MHKVVEDQEYAGMSVSCVQEVEAKFEKFGEVKEARIVRNPVNGESRGFGFVAMKYEEDVDVVGNLPTTPYLPASQICIAADGVCHPCVTLWKDERAFHAGHQDTRWRGVAGQAPWC